jgi:hypothetical protein
VNKSRGSGHQPGMSVEAQLAGLRATERRNVALEVAIRAGCACAVAWVLTGSFVAAGAAGLVLGLLSARRHRIPSLDELAERIDRARGTHGLVRTALASEAGTANGSPLLVGHAVARADALLSSHGAAMVRPFRLPGSALAATAVVCFFVAVPSPFAPSRSVASHPEFHANEVLGDRSPAPSGVEEDDRAQRRRTGTRLGDFGRFVATGGRSTTGMEGAVGEVAGAGAANQTETMTERPVDPDPCPPDAVCAPSGMRNDRASSAGGGASGRAPAGDGGARRTDARGEPGRADGSEGIDQGELGMGTEAARGSPQGHKADGVTGDGTGASGDGVPEKASEVRPVPDQQESDEGGAINGAGGTDPGIDEQSERAQLAIAEERVEGLWQASAEGTVDAIEDGLAGEQTSVPWRDLHAWYEAIAEDAVAKESVPMTRRAYVQDYFDAIAPSGDGE